MTQITQIVPAGQTYCVYISSSACGGAFVDDYCKRVFLVRLFNGLRPFQVQLHAYVVLNEEVCLLLSPGSDTGLSSLINSVVQSYTEYYQQRFERGTSPISKKMLISRVTGKKLTLDCQKYIERRPLDCNIRQHAGAYEWSSYTANSFGCRSPFVTSHKALKSFVNLAEYPYKKYREFIATAFPSNYLPYIHTQITSGRSIVKKPVPICRPIAKKRRHLAIGFEQ